jgi:hypothetical protein
MLPSLPNTTQPMLANKKFRPDQESKSVKNITSPQRRRKTQAKSADSQKYVQMNKANTHFELPNPNVRA